MPEENIAPSPRSDDAVDRRVVGRGAQRLADGEHQLVVERVALLGAVEDDVADGAAIVAEHEVRHRRRSL